MLDYRSLLALAAVNREGSYERAAAHLNMTPSAISQRIKALEAKVCGKVLVRGAKGRLTPLGALLVKHTTQVKVLETELFGRLKIHNSGTDGHIKIVVSADHLSLWFMNAICNFLKENNSFHIEIISASGELADDMMKNCLAIASITETKSDISGYKSLFIGEIEYHAVSSVDVYEKYFLRNNVSEDKISEINCFRSCGRGMIPLQWARKAFGRDIFLKYVTVPSSHDIFRALNSNVGWAVVPILQSAPYLESGQLVRFCENVRIKAPVYWRHPENSGGALANLTKVVRQVATDTLTRTTLI